MPSPRPIKAAAGQSILLFQVPRPISKAGSFPGFNASAMSDDSGIASHGARGERVLGPSANRFGSVQSRVPTGAGELMPPLLSCEQWPGNAAAAAPIRGCFGAPVLAQVRTEQGSSETFEVVGGKCLKTQLALETDHRLFNGSGTRSQTVQASSHPWTVVA